MPFIILTMLITFSAIASSHRGVATRDGKVIYIEEHVVTYEKETLKGAKTNYVTAEGKLIASIESDFSQSTPLANHVFIDPRFKRSYGVRWENGKPWMYDKKDGEKEEKVEVDKKLLKEKLVIGGQGLHYYMAPRIAEFKTKRTPIAILIPGKLDWYNFLVTYEGSKNGLEHFVIKTQSAILRLFAPKLEVWYTPEGKLMKYRGLSNLSDEEGDNQLVEINYQY